MAERSFDDVIGWVINVFGETLLVLEMKHVLWMIGDDEAWDVVEKYN